MRAANPVRPCLRPILRFANLCELCRHGGRCVGDEVSVWRCGDCDQHHVCLPVDGSDYRPGEHSCPERDR